MKALLKVLLFHFIVTVTWNGTSITGPVLIYQDELVVDNRASPTATPTRDGTLICTSRDQHSVNWHVPDRVSSATDDFRQIRTESGVTPSVSRLSALREDVSRDDDVTNGLWTCRLNEEFSTSIPVGIYGRGGGEWLAMISYWPCMHSYKICSNL